MAYETGTATNYQDYWDKLIAFLTTNVDLVAAEQNWTVAWTAPGGAPNMTDVVLSGPGLAGTDEVLIGLRLVVDVPGDKFTIFMCGMTGIIPGATEYDGHVNVTPLSVRMFLGSGATTYWFTANGRRFVAVAKVSTVYESLYGGLILPYSQPSSFPYPMFIGGSAGEGGASVDWRSVSEDHTLFHQPRYNGTSPTSAWLLDPTGAWLQCGDSGSLSSTPIYIAPDIYFHQSFSMSETITNQYYGYREMKDRIQACYGGDFTLGPFTLIQGSPAIQTYGILHGVYHVPGLGNYSENIVTIGGVDHLVVQNTFRTLTGDYIAIALEE